MSAIIPAILSVGEALSVGRALGLDDTLLRDVLAATPLAPIAARAFADRGASYPGRLAAKDLTLAHTAASTPLVTAARAVLASTGQAESDIGVIARNVELLLR